MFAERTNPAAGVTARDKWKERSEFPLIMPAYATLRVSGAVKYPEVITRGTAQASEAM